MVNILLEHLNATVESIVTNDSYDKVQSDIVNGKYDLFGGF